MPKSFPQRPALSELRRGFELSIQNAIRFNQDAQSLKKQGRLESATLLGIYSLDEMGKAMLLSRAAMHPDKSESSWRDYLIKFREHTPKIQFVLEIFWMFQSAFLLGQDRFLELVKEETRKVMELRAGIAFVDLKDGAFSLPLEIERDRCLKFISVLDQWFSLLERMLPRLREMLDEDEIKQAKSD
jgi:AbiV family abortive infection protein